jgi:hypothetical protein
MNGSYWNRIAGQAFHVQQSKLLFGVTLLSVATLTVGCSAQEPTPELLFTTVPLPSTWTPEAETTHIEEPDLLETPTLPGIDSTAIVPTETEPVESWWALSFVAGRKLQVRSIFETESGGFLLWIKEPGFSNTDNRDLIVKISKGGRPEWQISISPGTARLSTVQTLEDGSLLLFGIDDARGEPFTIHLTPDGEILSKNTYMGIYSNPEKYFARLPIGDQTLAIGRADFSGAVEDVQFVEAFTSFPDGEIVAAGPIWGTTTGAQGGTFSALRGLWAARINQNNQVIWKKVFETKAGPLFIGSVLTDGSTILVKEYANTNSIVRIDLGGNVVYWRSYVSPGVVLGISESPDGGIILVDSAGHILKLNGQGAIEWVRKSPDKIPRYAFEASDGTLLLILGPSDQGISVVRFQLEEAFPDCELIQLEEPRIGVQTPLLPANIGAVVEISPRLKEPADGHLEISVNKGSINLREICRYVLPTSAPGSTAAP